MVSIPVGCLAYSIRWIEPGLEPSVLTSVGRADPVVWVAATWLARCDRMAGVDWSNGRLMLTPEHGDPVIYRQVGYDTERDSYLLAWPD